MVLTPSLLNVIMGPKSCSVIFVELKLNIKEMVGYSNGSRNKIHVSSS